MPKTKQCMYSLCQNTTFFCKTRTEATNFIPFPRPRKELDRCHIWISACSRFDDRLTIEKLSKKSYYICEEHFVGAKGPTVENPNPIPFKETTETRNLMNQVWTSPQAVSLQDNDSEPVLDKSEILSDTSMIVGIKMENEESDQVDCLSEAEILPDTSMIDGIKMENEESDQLDCLSEAEILPDTSMIDGIKMENEESDQVDCLSEAEILPDTLMMVGIKMENEESDQVDCVSEAEILPNSSMMIDAIKLENEESDQGVCLSKIEIYNSEELENNIQRNLNTISLVENTLDQYTSRLSNSNVSSVISRTGFSKQANTQTLAGKSIPYNWTLIVMEEEIALTKQNIEKGLITNSFILKDHKLRGTLKINGKVINSNHPLVKSLPDVLNEDLLFQLLIAVDNFPLCSGITQYELVNHFQTKAITEGYINLCDDALHSTFCEIIQSRQKKQNKINLESKDLCNSCTRYRRVLMNSIRRQKKTSRLGEKRLQYLQRDDLVKKLKTVTQRNRDQKKKLQKMRLKIKMDCKKFGQYFSNKDKQFIWDQLEKQKKMLPINSLKAN